MSIKVSIEKFDTSYTALVLVPALMSPQATKLIVETGTRIWNKTLKLRPNAIADDIAVCDIAVCDIAVCDIVVCNIVVGDAVGRSSLFNQYNVV